MSDRILVLIPCHDCAEDIPRILGQFQAPISSYLETILVLDNGSQDGTREAAIAAALKLPRLDIRVARNRRHFSLDGSHQAAFHFALRRGYSHVLVLSDTRRCRTADIMPALKQKLHRKYDACLGAGLSIFNACAMRSPRTIRYSETSRFNILAWLDRRHEELSVTCFPVRKKKAGKPPSAWPAWLARARHLLAPVQVPMADRRAARHSEYRFDLIFPLLMQGVA